MRQSKMKLWFTTLICLIFCVFSGSSGVESADKIRVGVFPFSGFYNIDENGNLSGYGYEYLQEISKYTGWQYEYVVADWAACLNMLERGEIDLVGLVPFNSQYSARFDYPDVASGIAFASLYVKKDNQNIAYQDYSSFAELTIGTANEHVDPQFIRQFCDTYRIQPAMREYRSSEALFSALMAGEVDAMVCVDAMRMDNVKNIAPIAKYAYYFITTKNNRQVLKQLNYAQEQIKNITPYFEPLLHHKYFSSSIIAFTKEEQKYIANSAAMTVVYDPNWAPIESYDPETNTIKGITADIFGQIAAFSGLKFTFVTPDDFSDALHMLQNGDVDLITGVEHIKNRIERPIRLSESMLTIPSMAIKNKESAPNQTCIVVLPKDYTTTEKYINAVQLDGKVIYKETIEDCFDAIAAGEADLTYANIYTTNNLMQNPKYKNLVSTLVQHYSDKIHVGISPYADPILVSIINKSLRSISKDEMDAIILKNTIHQSPDNSIMSAIYRNTEEFMIISGCVILLVICILTYIILMKNRYNKTIEKLAFVDDLTGMWNHNKFKKEAAALLRGNPGQRYAILFLNIEKFKYINNSYGFDVGDQVLRHISSTLAANISVGNIFARFSADQFILMIRYGDIQDIVAMLESLYRKLRNFQRNSMDAYPLSFSCGISLIGAETGKDGRSAADINFYIDQALMAQRTLKGKHGNSYIFYNDAFREQIVKEKRIEDIMEKALKDHEFILYYQPKYNLSDTKIAGAEALVRWQRPDCGLIYPNDFIPIFEKNGFIAKLDFYILETVFSQIRSWLAQGKDLVPISVNLSRVHINNPNFVSQLKALFDRYAIPRRLVEFEITESAFIDNFKNLQKMICKLKEYDFIVSMDDFGSGYSSLNLLKEVPFDILKIDKDFFQEGYSIEREQIIIASIVEMSRKLKIKVVAEGVETERQADFLRKINCDMAQGYMFSRPMPLSEFEKNI